VELAGRRPVVPWIACCKGDGVVFWVEQRRSRRCRPRWVFHAGGPCRLGELAVGHLLADLAASTRLMTTGGGLFVDALFAEPVVQNRLADIFPFSSLVSHMTWLIVRRIFLASDGIMRAMW